jgi:hypothetical protein
MLCHGFYENCEQTSPAALFDGHIFHAVLLEKAEC